MPKLSAEIRERVRKAVRSHPDAKKYVARLSEIGGMKKDDLLALAERVGIDVSKIIVGAVNDDFGLRHYSGPDLERWNHSHEHPAFSGQLELDLDLSILGLTVTRKLRVTYTHTPDWEYFDLHRNSLFIGWPSGTMSFELKAFTEDDQLEHSDGGKRRRSGLTPVWLKADLFLEEGVFSREMNDAIDNAVEARCQEEDRQRRTERGIDVPAYPALPRVW